MTMKERLNVHAELERQNKRNMERFTVKQLYRKFVRNGQFEEGRELLKLLRSGSVYLGLSDVDCNVQTALEDAGVYVWFSRDGYTAVARLGRRCVA